MSELIERARTAGDGQVLSDAADERTRELIDGFVHQAGPPPAAFCWVALGSHARRELHCASDQDHALVWETGRAASGSYAADLAGTVIGGLESFGMRRCSGGYMADRWSHSLAQWVSVLRGYLEAPTPQAVLDADIFLDIRALGGGLGIDPAEAVLRAGADSDRLLHGLATNANSFGAGLGAFGRLPDRLDIKKGGLAPLVMLARLYGLQSGSRAVGTVGRLRDAAGRGALSPDLSDRLIDAFAVLSDLRLRHQLAQWEQGEPLSDVIDTTALPRTGQAELREALRAVKSAQSVTAVTFRTDL